MVSTAKVCSIVIVFTMSCFCGLILPFFVLRFLRKKYNSSSDKLNTVLSILNCFSGGVFFSTSILGLLPEAREQLEEAQVHLNDIDNYPAAELILGIGFLAILIIESMTIVCHKKHSKRDDNRYTISMKESATKDGRSLQKDDMSVSTASAQGNEVNEMPTETRVDEFSMGENMDDMSRQGMTTMRNIAMLLALSIHMVFEGLELGLLEKETEVWSLLLALSIHKTLVFFSIGIKMCESATFIKFAIAMTFLSAVTPTGVGIGILMTSQAKSTTILKTSAILQSFAVGTFVYVTFFEVLLREFISSEVNRNLKTFATVFGFASFAVISYLMPE